MKDEEKNISSEEIFKWFGETNKSYRPKFSIDNILKSIYFVTKRVSWIADTFEIVVDNYQFIMTLETCINDEEEFWFSMCYVKNIDVETPTWNRCIEIIENKAKQIGEEKEAAKLLLLINKRGNSFIQ